LAFADKDTLTRYVLGDLSPEDRQRLEEEYLADDAVWEQLGTVENDLIDSYVRGDLPEQHREQLEQHFLDSHEKYERVEVARLLMDNKIRRSITAAPVEYHKQHDSWLEWLVEFAGGRQRAVKFVVGAIAAPGLAVVAVAAFLIPQNRHLQTELGRLQSQQAALQSHIEQLEQQSRIASAGENTAGNSTRDLDQREPATISALLIPGLSRQTEQQNTSGVLQIPATASWVRLMLDLQRDQYRQYQVVIETPEGNRVGRAEGLASEPGKQGGRIVSVRLASQALKKGDYVITLSGQKAGGGLEVVDSYSLSVIR
jgi:anti-sigma factor RsiW